MNSEHKYRIGDTVKINREGFTLHGKSYRIKNIKGISWDGFPMYGLDTEDKLLQNWDERYLVLELHRTLLDRMKAWKYNSKLKTSNN